jgi:SAM-dependent methyltransferase
MSFYSQFAEAYEQAFPFREEVYRFLAGHAGDPGSPVLDIGCGPGHYCGRLAREGYRATGIDLDESMIDVARRNYPEAGFRCLDMRHVDTVGSGFRCTYSIGNVAAHLPREEFAKMVGKISSMLVPGGRWIMQVVNWEPLLLLPGYEFPVKRIRKGDAELTFHRSYSGMTPQSVIFSLSLREEGERLFDGRMRLYPVTPAEYLQLHEAAGFECMGSFSDFSGSPVRNEPGTGLVMVFRKP